MKNGIIILHKGEGLTSQTAVNRIKRLLGAPKAGHTGTLDPLATGVLPILVGNAVKAGEYMLSSDKHYIATLRLGLVSDTEDITGTVLSSTDACPAPEEVIKAAKMAHIHSFIEGLPDGYDTVLSDDGVNISKGHKQLITIARAMLADAPMLILDEATSNVDSRTEQKIQEAMYSLMEDRTCFVIAHRLSTIQNADVILVVKDGNVIEQGNHEALMSQKGFYYSLYHSQFET